MKVTALKTVGSKLPEKLTRALGKTKLNLSKHSPEILIGVGVVGIVAGTVTACKATLKAEEILDDHMEMLDHIDGAIAISENGGYEYTEEDQKKDLAIAYAKTGWNFVKLYGPSVMLIGGGIASILVAHNIMHKRQLALMAAYSAVDQAFKEYRQRVVEKYGADEDHHLRYGSTDGSYQKAIDEKTGEVKDPEGVPVIDGVHPSQYARFFDETSTEWHRNADYNLMFLHQQQDHFNRLLRSRGYVTLNEVYDALGFVNPSQAGFIVGWVYDADHPDKYIDFGIYNVDRYGAKIDFVNGTERSILLDFNVDGVIYDKI